MALLSCAYDWRSSVVASCSSSHFHLGSSLVPSSGGFDVLSSCCWLGFLPVSRARLGTSGPGFSCSRDASLGYVNGALRGSYTGSLLGLKSLFECSSGCWDPRDSAGYEATFASSSQIFPSLVVISIDSYVYLTLVILAGSVHNNCIGYPLTLAWPQTWSSAVREVPQSFPWTFHQLIIRITDWREAHW